MHLPTLAADPLPHDVMMKFPTNANTSHRPIPIQPAKMILRRRRMNTEDPSHIRRTQSRLLTKAINDQSTIQTNRSVLGHEPTGPNRAPRSDSTSAEHPFNITTKTF